MDFLEHIEKEVGQPSDEERALAERELELLERILGALAERVPADGSEEEHRQAFDDLLREDVELTLGLRELLEAGDKNRASPSALIASFERRRREEAAG